MSERVYFYPHRYLRERQLDVIRHWPRERALNPQIAQREGAQVSRAQSLRGNSINEWIHRIPLMNVKRRPAEAPRDAVVYVWGGVMLSGRFILDLDNPYALTAYNLSAMRLYRPILHAILLSPRCVEIRCMSQACRETLGILFGKAIYEKAVVHYPSVGIAPADSSPPATDHCRFLFIATQFEIKGGLELLEAFKRVRDQQPNATLTLITHLPSRYESFARSIPGVTIAPAKFSRLEVRERYLSRADVLVHPTYVESFGMVALEALACGLAIIATDVYSLREMVRPNVNGFLLHPPVSIWDGYRPSQHYVGIGNIKSAIQGADMSAFVQALAEAMIAAVKDLSALEQMKRSSMDLYRQHFRA